MAMRTHRIGGANHGTSKKKAAKMQDVWKIKDVHMPSVKTQSRLMLSGLDGAARTIKEFEMDPVNGPGLLGIFSKGITYNQMTLSPWIPKDAAVRGHGPAKPRWQQSKRRVQ